MVDIGYIKGEQTEEVDVAKLPEPEKAYDDLLTAQGREAAERRIPRREHKPKPDHELIPTSAEAIGRATISIDKVNPPDDDDFDVRGL